MNTEQCRDQRREYCCRDQLVTCLIRLAFPMMMLAPRLREWLVKRRSARSLPSHCHMSSGLLMSTKWKEEFLSQPETGVDTDHYMPGVDTANYVSGVVTD